MKNKKVLIVDDNALNRKVFENIIGLNYSYDIATNGREAICKIKDGKFDIILMDIQMPVLDGISALRLIKEDNLTNVPIIAISAFSNQDDKEYFLSTGFDDFMAKPVKPKDLLESIHYHLDKNWSKEKNNINKSPYIDIDESVVKKLIKYNTPENIKLVYLDFLEEAYRLLEEIKHLIEIKEYDEIGEKLHILKGNSGTLGALKLYEESSRLEKKVKALDYKNILEDYFVLETLLNNFRINLGEQQMF